MMSETGCVNDTHGDQNELEVFFRWQYFSKGFEDGVVASGVTFLVADFARA